MMIKKGFYLFIYFIVSSLLSSCGGRTPNPIMMAQYGDDQKSCKVLKYEIFSMQGEMQRVLPTDKTGKNVALGTAGIFLIFPWFFMDFSHTEQIEYDAYRARYNHLASIAVSKQCNIEKQNYPSIEEMKNAYKKHKKEQVK